MWRGLDALFGDPAQDRHGDELRAVVGSKVARSSSRAYQLREHLDHAPRPDAAGHVDRQRLARQLVHDGQALGPNHVWAYDFVFDVPTLGGTAVCTNSDVSKSICF
jgi:hypothetical protein